MVSVSCALSDSEILLEFKSSLTNNTALKSWRNDSGPVCNGRRSSWIGVFCENGTVWGLKLENMGLTGTIDAATLSALSRLRTLSFMNNNFNGPIPEFSNLTRNGPAQQAVSIEKRFSGQIPASVATLTKLLELKLDGNWFSGRIPDFKQKTHVYQPVLVQSIRCSQFQEDDLIMGYCDSHHSRVLILLALVVLIIISLPKRQQQASKWGSPSPPSYRKRKTGLKAGTPASSVLSPRSRSGRKALEAAPKLTFLRDDDGEKFDLPDLLKASAEILGSGCFGSSYKTALPNGTTMVVKRYKQMNSAEKEDFQEHMRRIGRLRHNNVLTLVAYYYRGMRSFFSSNSGTTTLDWPTRLKIVKGVAKGLAYLYGKGSDEDDIAMGEISRDDVEETLLTNMEKRLDLKEAVARIERLKPRNASRDDEFYSAMGDSEKTGMAREIFFLSDASARGRISPVMRSYEDTDIARALVDYILRFRSAELTTMVSKAAPDYCTVYVIGKGKISSVRSATASPPSRLDMPPPAQVLLPPPGTIPEAPNPSARSPCLRYRGSEQVTIFENKKQIRAFIPESDIFVSSGRPSTDNVSILATAQNPVANGKELQCWKLQEEQKIEEARLAEEAALSLVEKEKEKCKNVSRVEDEGKLVAASHDVRYRKYTIQDIEAATDLFSPSLKIGEGGYGPVYRCYLDHTPVAIKVLRSDATQGELQFQREVEVLSCIRHPNMVLLLGACPEYCCLRSQQVFPTPNQPEPIVHRDLKPGNICSIATTSASDVGLARLVPPSVSDSITQYRMTAAVENAIENGTFTDVLDSAVADWPMEETLAFASSAGLHQTTAKFPPQQVISKTGPTELDKATEEFRYKEAKSAIETRFISFYGPENLVKNVTIQML
ncbi:hypothetical protein F3Y22_tig00110415pilonHSYRG00255 [Hibiscus syriacus]|uniref:RING-type E3 ubiquitin transferase n=1 Tax=Hibiscus syriacus TaxID=106335 RepID=A0A6A3ASU1_HIBSY|nr:hypothetical protein F3Y22_tig00110415pilonHSYRG00255 [Hibiscus syriacus]